MSRSVLVKMTACEPEHQLQCSSCGAVGHASCGCDAPYVRVQAAIADESNQLLSTRALAAKVGVSHMTIGRARKNATVTHVTVEKRVGLDGKARRMPQKVEPTVESNDLTPKMQRKLEVHGWYQRAELAAQEARYAPLGTCPCDAKMKRLAKNVLKAWTEVLTHVGEDDHD
jgi:hypothetical protein